LGGSFDDYGAGIAADAAGNAYVTGFTNSGDFPLKNPAQPTRSDWDAFVTKIDPMGSSLVYSTFLGGSRYDAARAIAVDAAGQAHVIGATMSADFPVVRPVRRLFGGGGWDAFVTKLSSDGGSFVYSTFLGGSGYDDGGGIAVEGGGDATVTGRTGSYDFPTVGGVQWSFAGGEEDAFVTKIVEDGPRPEPTPAPSPAASGGRFEQDDDRIAYSGGWYSNTTCGASRGSAARRGRSRGEEPRGGRLRRRVVLARRGRAQPRDGRALDGAGSAGRLPLPRHWRPLGRPPRRVVGHRLGLPRRGFHRGGRLL